MIKKLTVAFLLFVTGTLFAQITNVPHTTFLVVDATGNVVGELLIDPLVLPGALTVTGALTAKDSVWIGTFEGSTFRDLNIKQTTTARAIRIEEKTGTEAYEIGIGTDGTFGLYDDDGSLTFYIADGTNQVIVPDSLRVDETSRFTGDAKFESDVLVEGDLDVQGQFTSTLSLDLPYYFSRNVVDITCYTDNYTWENGNWIPDAGGVTDIDETNFLTDDKSTRFKGGLLYDGFHIDFPDKDLTHFTDKDTSVAADIISFALNISTQDIADLGDANGLAFLFNCDTEGTRTNYFRIFIDDSDLSNGWNFFKPTKSAFTGYGFCVSDTAWALVKGMEFYLAATPDDSVTFSADNFQLIRAIGGEPNPFQSEGPNGTWTADWTQEGNGNVWLVEESGQLGVFAGDATSYPASVTAFNEFSASGVIDPGATDRAYFLRGGTTSMRFRAWDQSLNIRGMNDQAYVSVPFTEFASGGGGRLWWKLTRSAGVVVGKASVDGVSWVTVRDSTDGGLESFNHYPGATNRIRSFGLSAVAYAAEAGVAQRLQGIHFYRGAEGLEITIGDSVYHLVIDSVRAK